MAEPELESRIAELERRVESLESTLRISPPGPGGLSPLVLEQIQRGDKIGAIKQYRQETGLGLAEAKAAIDAYTG